MVPPARGFSTFHQFQKQPEQEEEKASIIPSSKDCARRDAVEAAPRIDCCRIPRRLGPSQRLQGDDPACVKAEDNNKSKTTHCSIYQTDNRSQNDAWEVDSLIWQIPSELNFGIK